MKTIYVVKKDQCIVHKADTRSLKAKRKELIRKHNKDIWRFYLEEKKKYDFTKDWNNLFKPKKKRRLNKKQKEALKDKGFYSSKFWRTLRKKILERDGYKCQECGKTKMLHVHHVKYRHISNEPEDLITLCKRCHAKKHPVNGKKMLGII